MHIVLTRNKKWWQFWISSEPITMVEGKDYICDGKHLTLNFIPKFNDNMSVTYEHNPSRNIIR